MRVSERADKSGVGGLPEQRNKKIRMAGAAAEKKECCGCGACAQACPAGCIQMRQDQEGFRYPYIQKELCRNCGVCSMACPMEHPAQGLEHNRGGVLRAYGGWHKDADIRFESSSGGAFSLFARHIIRQGGIVFGCVLGHDMRAVHIGIESEDELWKMRGSKYVQSDMGNVYTEIKKELAKNRKVLFTGTPCQAAGLLAYLGKKDAKLWDANLWIVDFICHGVPSPAVFERYLKEMEKKYAGKAVSFRFRNKDHGWNQTGLMMGTCLQFADGRTVRRYPAYKDAFMNGFLEDLYLRPSCYDCRFKQMPKSYADITIADFWGVNRVCRALNDKKGTSLLLVHSGHGKKLWEQVKDGFYYREVDFDRAVRKNRMLVTSVDQNPKRSLFFSQYQTHSFAFMRRKYLSAGHFFIYKAKQKMLKKFII